MLKGLSGYLLLSFPKSSSICAYVAEQIHANEIAVWRSKENFQPFNFLKTLLRQLKAGPAL